MIGRSVLIVGGGIAGPALAFWLLRHGFVPTIVGKLAMRKSFSDDDLRLPAYPA